MTNKERAATLDEVQSLFAETYPVAGAVSEEAFDTASTILNILPDDMTPEALGELVRAQKTCDLVQGEPDYYLEHVSDQWRCGECGEEFVWDEIIPGFESPEDVATGGNRYCSYCGCRITGLRYHRDNALVTDDEAEDAAGRVE